ncbi:MAG: hypothetical protein P8Y42_02340 [Exilibacterium sp.]
MNTPRTIKTTLVFTLTILLCATIFGCSKKSTEENAPVASPANEMPTKKAMPEESADDSMDESSDSAMQKLEDNADTMVEEDEEQAGEAMDEADAEMNNEDSMMPDEHATHPENEED